MSDFDFEDDGEDGFDLDFDGGNRDKLDPPKNKREAITRVLNDATTTAFRDTKDIDKNVEHALDKALPSELNGIRDGYNDTANSLSKMYRDTTKELRPKLASITKSLDKMVPDQLGPIKKLTAGLSSKLSSGDDRRGSRSGPSIDEEIQSKLDGLLPSVEYNKRLEIAKDHISLNRHKDNVELLSEIATYTQAGFEFDRKRVAAYQRKHLELMYKSVYYQKKGLETNDNSLNTIKNQLEAITTNTGLPEVLKIKKTERLGEAIRDGYVGTIQENLFGNASWLERGLKKLRSKVMDTVSDMSGGLDMVEMMAGMSEDMDMGMGDQSMGDRGGGFIVGQGRNLASNKIKAAILSNPKSRKMVYELSNTYRNAPERLEEYLNGDKASNPLVKSVGSAILGLIRPESGNYSVDINNVALNDPAIFDGRVYKTVTNIIPGFLSRILSQITSLRTGEEAELIDYNFKTNKFQSKGGLRKSVRSEIMESVQESGVSRNIDRLLDGILPKNADKKQRALLKRRLITQLAENRAVSTKGLRAEGVFEGLDSNIVGSINAYENDNKDNIEDILRANKRLLPNIKTHIVDLIHAGYEDILISEGIIKRSGGKYVISIIKFKKFLNLPPLAAKSTTETVKEKRVITNAVKGIIDGDNKTISRLKKRVTSKAKSFYNDNLSTHLQPGLDKINDGYNTHLSERVNDTKKFLTDTFTKDKLTKAYNKIKDPKERKEFIESVSTTMGVEKDKLYTHLGITKPPEDFVGPLRPTMTESITQKVSTIKDSVIDVEKSPTSNEVPEVQALATMDKSSKNTLKSVIKKFGLDKVMNTGIISTSRDGLNTMVDTIGLKNIGSRIKDTATRYSDNSGIESSGLDNNKMDTHLEYMKTLIAVTTSISSQLDGLLISNNGDEKEVGDGIVKRSMGKLSKMFKSGRSKLPGLSSIGNLVRGRKPKDFMLNKISSISGGINKLGGLVSPMYSALLSPLQAVSTMASGLLGGMMGHMGKIPNLLKSAYRGTKKISSKLFRSIFGDSNKVVDLYTKSNPIDPVIRANALKMGLYIDTSTGNVIHKLSDINGAVTDIDGNIVLTHSDIIEGLYTADGTEVRLGSARRKGLVGKLAKLLPTNKIKNLKMPKLGLGGTRSKIKSKLPGYKMPELSSKEYGAGTQINYGIYRESVNHTSLLTDIRDMVEELVNPGRFNDKNNDGNRDRGWRDRLLRINKKSTKKDLSKDKNGGKDKDTSSTGMMTAMASMLGNMGGNVLSSLASMFGLGGALAGGKATGKAGSIIKKTLGKLMGKLSVKGLFDTVKGMGAKSLVKKIPVAGAIAGAGFAGKELYNGNFTNAVLELASGIASIVPGYGTAASTAIDAYAASRNGGDTEGKTNGSTGRSTASIRQGNIPILRTPMVAPDDASMYLTIASRVRMDGLNPTMRNLFYSMVSEYGAITGKKIQVNSAYRILTNKGDCSDKTDRTCNKTSMHVYGLAIDINSSGANEMESLGLMRKYGFTRPVGQEPWHLEPSGIQVDLNRARNDSEWATEQILASTGRGGGGYGTLSQARKYGRDTAVAKTVLQSGKSIDVTTKTASVSKKTNKVSSKVSPAKNGKGDNVITDSNMVYASTIPKSRGTVNKPEREVSRASDNSPITYDTKVAEILDKSLQVQLKMVDELKSIRGIISSSKQKSPVIEKKDSHIQQVQGPSKLPNASVALSRR